MLLDVCTGSRKQWLSCRRGHPLSLCKHPSWVAGLGDVEIIVGGIFQKGGWRGETEAGGDVPQYTPAIDVHDDMYTHLRSPDAGSNREEHIENVAELLKSWHRGLMAKALLSGLDVAKTVVSVGRVPDCFGRKTNLLPGFESHRCRRNHIHFFVFFSFNAFSSTMLRCRSLRQRSSSQATR